MLRDGKLVSTGPVAGLNRLQLISRMLGRDAADLETSRTQFGGGGEIADEKPILEATELQRKFVIEDISLVVRPGEVVGLAGLLGFRAQRDGEGDLRGAATRLRHGRPQRRNPTHRNTPASRIRSGVAMLPEDRKAEGLVPGMSIKDNICLASLEQLAKGGFVSRKKQTDIVDVFMKRLRIKASGPDQKVRELSGGNQQKVLLARLHVPAPQGAPLDEPTRGIDVGAKAEVQALIAELAEKGLGVVLISSELEEVVEGSDTVLVLRDGAALGSLFGDEISEDAIMNMIAGAAAEAAEATEPTETTEVIGS